MNEELQALQARREQARRQRDEINTIETQKSYETLKKELKRKLEKARGEFFSRPTTAKEMWAELRKHALGPSQHLKHDQIPDKTTANRFNNYFANVGRHIAEELAQHNCEPPAPIRPPTVCSSTFKVRPATLPELSLALRRLSSSNAAGSDGVQLCILRQCFAVIGPIY